MEGVPHGVQLPALCPAEARAVRVGGDAGPGIELEVWAMPEDRLGQRCLAGFMRWAI